MGLIKFDLKFWANLSLVVAILYVIVFYFFSPPNNLCQMTFMMEPPKFLPVPIEVEKDSDVDETESTNRINHQGNSRPNLYYKSRYILYMYSEFGFPQTSNIERDLKDSMPVLFVPGSAGSYQQVRSLASTCIRYQLQSLKASKFAFYTIDFNNEHSGVDGKIVEEQTLFVDKAVKQILKLHTNETTGVILIGHSVGGFISKALFTLPKFNPKTVPLLINLASPLTSPHLYFDERTKNLYDRTNLFWTKNKSIISETISISISGGKLDRLVPTHLSMDPQYDLCLTTSSIKDVWLAADHVSITWCRELMQKLAVLLSALMDKRNTRIISDKNKALSIINEELLSKDDEYSELPVINKDWKSMRPFKLINFHEFYSATRNQLGDIILILNMTSDNSDLKQDTLIHIDHIETLKSSGIFSCQNFKQLQSGHINCDEKIDLTNLAKSVPSRKYEPKKTVLKISKEVYHEYIMIDFVTTNIGSYSDNKLPELLTVQRSEFSQVDQFYIPHVVEFILGKLILFKSYEQEIIATQQIAPMVYRKYKLVSLDHESKIFSFMYKSQECRNIDGQSRGSTIVFRQNNYLIESFHPDKHDKSMSVIVKLNGQKMVSNRIEGEKSQESHLEFYLDGSCSSHKLTLELDVLDLITSIIQKNLNLILSLTLLLAMLDMFRTELALCIVAKLGGLCGLFSICKLAYLLDIIIPVVLFIQRSSINLDMMDRFAIVAIIYVLAAGLLAFIKNLTSRIVDLAVIVQRAQLFLSRKINHKKEKSNNELPKQEKATSNGNSNTNSKSNKNNISTEESRRLGAFVISGLGTLIGPSFGMIFLLITIVMNRLELQEKLKELSQVPLNSNNNIHVSRGENNHRSMDNSKEDKMLRKLKLVECADDIIQNLMIWCILFIIYTIPSSLMGFELVDLLSVAGIQDHLIKNKMMLLFTLNVYMRMSRLDSFVKEHEENFKKSSRPTILHSFLIHTSQLLLMGHFLINYIGSHEGTFWLSIPFVNFHLLWLYLVS